MMETKKISLAELPITDSFEGYLWYSNMNTPEIFYDKLITDLPTDSSNPFIIEGNLWNSKNKISYLIKYIDGQHHVYEYKFNSHDDIGNCKSVQKKYLPNRFEPRVKKLKFLEFWRPVKDEFCNGFDVLQPAELVFIGFN